MTFGDGYRQIAGGVSPYARASLQTGRTRIRVRPLFQDDMMLVLNTRSLLEVDGEEYYRRRAWESRPRSDRNAPLGSYIICRKSFTHAGACEILCAPCQDYMPPAKRQEAHQAMGNGKKHQQRWDVGV